MANLKSPKQWYLGRIPWLCNLGWRMMVAMVLVVEVGVEDGGSRASGGIGGEAMSAQVEGR